MMMPTFNGDPRLVAPPTSISTQASEPDEMQIEVGHDRCTRGGPGALVERLRERVRECPVVEVMPALADRIAEVVAELEQHGVPPLVVDAMRPARPLRPGHR